MAGVYKGLTIELTGKTTQLEAALKRVQTKANGIDKEMKAVKKSLDLDPSGAEAYERQMQLLSQGAENAAKKLDVLKKAEAQLGKSGMSTDQWTKLQYDISEAEKEVASYNRQMADLAVRHAAADSAIGKTGAKLEELGAKLDPIGQKMQSVGKGATKYLTVPIVGAAAASVKAATDIDTALTGVRKTVDGTEEQYEALKDAAIEFSKVNGVSAAEVLNIQALGAQLGFTVDELDEFSRVVAGLDLSTNLDAENAATELAQFANVMGMSHGEVSNFASALIDLGNHFSTTEADVMNMAMRISGAGKSIGLTEADVLGLATALSSVGIEAEAGGTAISTILSGIDKDVALGTENLSRWAEVAGMSAEDFAAAWQDDALSAFQDVVAGMQDGGENLSVLLDELGVSSLRQTDAMKRLVNASEMLPNAVETANRAYEENTALSAEVANFNDSLAAKFEMLRNRVTAVAAEVGAPLADAMLEAIDAAEPLFDAIESGARAFAEMSDEEQGAVIQTVAVIAAVGPALTLFGKVTSNVSVLGKALTTLSTGLAKLDVATGGAKDGLTKVTDAAGKSTTAVKGASVAMGALKGAAIGLAIAGIAVLVSAIQDYLKKAEDYHKATDGLVGTTESLASASDILSGKAERQASSAGKAARAWTDYRKAAEESAEKGHELADAIGSAFSDAATQAGLVQLYSDRIRELAGNVDGDAAKFYELQAAIEKYNELTGGSIAIVDEYSGRINANTAELQANADAVKLNAYAKAASEMMDEAAKRGVEAQMELDAATQQLADDTAAYNDALERLSGAKTPWEREGAQAELDMYADRIAKGEQAVRSYQEQVDAAAETYKNLADKQAEYAKASDDAAKKAEELHANIDAFNKALEEAGWGTDAFAKIAEALETDVESLGSALTDAGISAQDMKSMGSDGFQMLYKAASGDISKIAALLDELDAQGISPKSLYVDDDGTLRTAEGEIIDLDNMTIGDKEFSVTADTDQAESALSRVKSAMGSIVSKTVTLGINAVGSVIGSASGGISTVELSRIPRHADGGMAGIANRATLTNVGWVGEAGAEAIIPLTNRRYVAPFARAVASEMSVGGSTTVYNINLSDFAINDDAEIRSATREYLGVLLRKGAMNVG